MPDLIIGIHSIVHALNNPNRGNKKLYATNDGLKELLKQRNISSSQLNSQCQQEILSLDKFDQTARKIFQRQKFHYQRIPSGLLLEIDPLQEESILSVHKAVEQKNNPKILCLDRVNDIQNAAAILRTAAFYAVPFLIVAKKGGFGMTPSFYRLASGATEYVRIISVNNLSRTLSKLKEKGISIFGFSESGHPWNSPTFSTPHTNSPPPCLVFGAESKGLSHAVERCVDQQIQIPPQGQIHTLNVSVASALAMEKFWNTKRA